MRRLSAKTVGPKLASIDFPVVASGILGVLAALQPVRGLAWGGLSGLLFNRVFPLTAPVNDSGS